MNSITNPLTFVVHTVDISDATILSSRFSGHLRQLVTNWLSQEQWRIFQIEIDRLEQQVAPYVSWSAQAAQVARAAAIARGIQMTVSDRFAEYWPAWILWQKNMRWLTSHLEKSVDAIPYVAYDEIVRLYKWLKYRIGKAIQRSQKPQPKPQPVESSTPSNVVYTRLLGYKTELQNVLVNAWSYRKGAHKSVRSRVTEISTMAQQIPDAPAWEVRVLKAAITQLVWECLSALQWRATPTTDTASSPLVIDKSVPAKPWTTTIDTESASIGITQYGEEVSHYLEIFLNDIRAVIAGKWSVWDWPFRQDAVSPFLRNLRDKVQSWAINPEDFSWAEVTMNLEVSSRYGQFMKRVLKWLKQKQWFKENLDVFVSAITAVSKRLNINLAVLQRRMKDFLNETPSPSQ